MRAVMHAIEKHFRAGPWAISATAATSTIVPIAWAVTVQATRRVRLRNQRPKIVDVQIAVLAHPPPDELGAGAFERQPGGDVGVVVHVGDDDLGRSPSVWAMPRLTRRMNDVAFMPKQISAGFAALSSSATLVARVGDRPGRRSTLRP